MNFRCSGSEFKKPDISGKGKLERRLTLATPKREKPAEEPGYCKSEGLANLFDISNQWIGQLTRDGVLKKHQTKAGPRYNVVEATRAYVKYLREKAAGRENNGDPEAERDKLGAEVRMKKARADIAELEAAELSGKMHRSEDVEAMTTDLVYAVRGMLIALPGRLAVDVVHAETPAEASVIIRSEVFKILEELAGYKYDPSAYAKRVRERQKWTDLNDDSE